MSHSLPGVATSTSTPLSRMRFCFCADIPPTIAATLTWGGRFLSLGCIAPSSSVKVGFLENSKDVTRELRWEDTWSANSRVGVRIKARRGRFLDEDGRGWESKWCRIGKPYASVFPDPLCSIFNHQYKIKYCKVLLTVWAIPTTSRPAKAKGKADFWMGVGERNDFVCNADRILGWRLNECHSGSKFSAVIRKF